MKTNLEQERFIQLCNLVSKNLNMEQISDLKTVDKTRNKVNVLYPHRNKYGVWSFTDLSVGLYEEPFVDKINDFIDMFTEGRNECIVYISDTPLPKQSGHLVKSKEDGIGWYKLEGVEEVGWLCGATLNYFSGYPENIYFRIELPKTS